MSKEYILRFAAPEEKEEVKSRLRANPLNEFVADGHILDYPSTQVLVAQREEEKHFLPVQKVLMLESISDSIDPVAIRDLIKGSELVASANQIREIYFLDGAGGIDGLAKRRGFEELPYKVYRLKVPNA